MMDSLNLLFSIREFVRRRILDGFRQEGPSSAGASRFFRPFFLPLVPLLTFLLAGSLPAEEARRACRQAVILPASTTILASAGETDPELTSVFRRRPPPGSGTAGHTVCPASLDSLAGGTQQDLFLRQDAGASGRDGLLAFAWGRVLLSAGESDLPLERFAEAFPRAESPAGSFLPGIWKDLPQTGISYCDQDPGAGDPLAAWSGGGFLTRKGEGPCLLRETGGPAASGLFFAAPGISAVAGNVAQYRALAEAYARKYTLPPSMVLAIMHAESNFNPLAVSRSSALGLMQVVPETAGNEVYRYLEGSQGIPSIDALLRPESNIQYGTAYLYLLASRYFNEVIDPAAREMCVIAAYNGGPGAVLRLFDQDREVAVARINAMSSEEVYAALTTRMPSLETRRYVEVVLGHQRTYTR
jgi:hypothetical protein